MRGDSAICYGSVVNDGNAPFSPRFGFRGLYGEITIREGVRDELRDGVAMLGYLLRHHERAQSARGF